MTDMNNPLGSREQDSGERNSGKQDRISNLPWEVLDIIIRKLTLVDAIRTSVLSKNWRYNWLSMSGFHLDIHAVTEICKCMGLDDEDTDDEDSDVEDIVAKDSSWNAVSSVVNAYILHHTNAIRSFSLIANCGKRYPDMYQWMHYLSRQAVEELSIQNTSRIKFKMPSHMFSFMKLRSLLLSSCALCIPSGFEGFKLLYKIDLDEVSICDADLSHLIRSCPLLEYLTLLDISGLWHLRINSPKLSELSLYTRLEDIIIEAAPNLSTVRFSHFPSRPFDDEDNPVLNLQSITNCLSRIGSLRLLNISEGFTRALGFIGLALRNNAVTSLTLDSWGSSIDMFRGCFSVLSYCRNIKHFTYLVGAGKHAGLISEDFSEYCGQYTFPNLESITLAYQSGSCIIPSMQFIYFIAVHSPKLKFLKIQTEGETVFEDDQVNKTFSLFKESCPHVSISYHHFKQPNRIG